MHSGVHILPPHPPPFLSRVNHESIHFCKVWGPSPPPPPPAPTYWGELLPLDILSEGRIKVLRIALIEAVDAPFLFDLHIPVHQNELSNGLWNRKESGEVRTSPPGLQERVTDRVGGMGGSRPEVTPVLQHMLQYKELGFCFFNWGVIDITSC